MVFRHAVANVICAIVFGSHFSYSDTNFLKLLDMIGNFVSFFTSPFAIVRAPAVPSSPEMLLGFGLAWTGQREGVGGSGQAPSPPVPLWLQVYNIFPSVLFRLPGPHRKVLAKCENLKGYIREQVEQHRQTLDPSSPRDYIDCFLMKAEKVELVQRVVMLEAVPRGA